MAEELKAQIAAAKRSSSAPVDRQQIAAMFLSANKWRIYLWVTYFPFNIVYTLSRDPFRIAYEFAWEKLLSAYTSIVGTVVDRLLAKNN